MAKSRYATSHLPESQFEPGSRGRVLKNLLHVTHKREIDIIEAELYALVQPKLMDMYTSDHSFTAADICTMHKAWLGEVYEWAGQYRQVNVSKGSFTFAMAKHVPNLMLEFEKKMLRKYTPCLFNTDEEIITALAIVHTELMLIHPFREGNGRVGRLLAVLMAFQVGLPGLDFSVIKGKKRTEYFNAVQAGMGRNYKPMENVFRSVLSATRRGHSEQI
jgi:cell filamentation protein